MFWQADGLLSGLNGPTGSASYSYTTAGLLMERDLFDLNTNRVRWTQITSRDGTGQPLTITNTIGNNLAVIGEALAWTGDQRLSTHTLSLGNTYTDNRAYVYQDMSRRLAEERQDVDASHRWTNLCTYDGAASGGLGVLTKVLPTASATPNWSGSLDNLSRISTETNRTVRRPAWGTNNGLAQISISVNGMPMPVTLTDNKGLQWRATLDL